MSFPTTLDAVDIAETYSAQETARLAGLDPCPFDICIFHDPCLDGFTAAWAVKQRWPDIELVGANYGQPPVDVAGKHVLIVDFSYKRDVLAKMGAKAASITILDHHDSAERELVDWTVGSDLRRLLSPQALREAAAGAGQGDPQFLPIQAVFDMNRSGARLAYDFCCPGDFLSPLVKYVEDRDLWRFHYPETKEVIAVLALIEPTLENWSQFEVRLASPLEFKEIVDRGTLLLKKFDVDLRRTLAETTRIMEIGGYPTPTANVPYYMASEAADILGVGVPFCATYYDTPTGRKFSLRVRDGDFACNRVAEQYGGGGHPPAAGFTMPHGWEGDGSRIDNEVVLGLPAACLSREQAEARIASLRRDQAWQARWMAGGAEEKAEWRRLTTIASGDTEPPSRQEAQLSGYRLVYGVVPAVEPALKLLRDYMTAASETDPEDLEKLNEARRALGLPAVD